MIYPYIFLGAGGVLVGWAVAAWNDGVLIL